MKKPGTNKKKVGGGMTLAELHEKEKKDKQDAKEAKVRHLKRAFAGIDRKAMQDQNLLFQTVSREAA